MRSAAVALISLLLAASVAFGVYAVIQHDPGVSDTEDGGAEEGIPGELKGKYLRFEVSGSVASRGFFSQTVTDISGCVTYTYLDYSTSRDAYYMACETSVVYARNSQITGSNSDTDLYWTDENDDGGTCTYGEQTVLTWSGKQVDVVPLTVRYTTGSSSVIKVEYCGIGEDDSWVVYMIRYTSVSSGQGSLSTQMTYILESCGDADLSSLTDLCIYTDAGISVTAEGTVAIGEPVTLTASCSGTGFGGWYDVDGNLLSADNPYTFDMALGTIDIVARNSQDDDLYAADYSCSVDLVADADSGTWTIGNRSYALGTSVVLDPGRYSAYFAGEKDGCPVYLYRDILVDGDSVVRTYSWTYDDVDYEISLRIDMDDYNAFAGALDVSERCDSWYATEDVSGDIAFVNTVSTADDGYLQEIASYFALKTAGMSAQKAADVVLSFVQDAIRYEYDSDIHGTDEYWQFPLETLFLGTGDCEDTSILFAAICKQMGWDAALLLLSSHMAAGITLDYFTDETPDYSASLSLRHGFVSDDHKLYYYCETTGSSSSFHVGDVPSGQALYKVIPVGKAPASSRT